MATVTTNAPLVRPFDPAPMQRNAGGFPEPGLPDADLA